jgi:S1-C subfamily serine protease
LVLFGGRAVATEGDVQSVLEETPAAGGRVAVELTRGDAALRKRVELQLGKGWREGGPRDLAYRNSVWKIGPRPGFGGRALTVEEKASLGLPKDRFALRVGYLVTWGKEAASGKNAQQAGIRKGDVVTSFDGKDDFEDERHWHAWFRLTLEPGRKVKIHGLRDRKPITIELPVLER